MPATAPARATHTDVVVGIDLGGTGTRFVTVDPSTNQVLARTAVPTPGTGTPDEILSFLREQINLVTRGQRPIAVGVGASGPVDLAGIIRNPDTLPAFTGVPIPDRLKSITDGPIIIDNDAVCAALAEHLAGAARHSPRSLHITLGTGVGVCLLNDDRPFRHHNGSQPEGGHISVATPTSRCYCGRSACWEQAASRQTLQRAAARILNRPPTDKTVISELAARAARDDADALAAFDTYGQGIADGLGTLLTLYGPAVVVIGGSAAGYFDLYRKTIETSLNTLKGWIPVHKIVKTALDDYGGAIGGARLASIALREAPGESSPTRSQRE
jgi:glucokinase